MLGGINRAGRGEEAGEVPLESEMDSYHVPVCAQFTSLLESCIQCKLLAYM